MAFSKNFNELFIKPDIESEEWDSKMFDYGLAQDVENLTKHLESANEIYLEEKQIYTAINSFTLDTDGDNEEESMRLIDGLKDNELVEDSEVTKSTLVIKTTNGDIKVWKLSEIIPELKMEDSDLTTENRKGKCHEKSIKIANSLGEIKSDVVTGYIFGYSDKAVRSWCENNMGILGRVVNVEDGFADNPLHRYRCILRRNAKPLSRIDSKTIKEDSKVLNKFYKLGSFNIKEYLLFRDEIMKDFEKNKEIIENER